MTTIYGDGFIADRVPELPPADCSPYDDVPPIEYAWYEQAMRAFYAAGVAAGMEKAAAICDGINSESGNGFETFAEAIRAAIRSQED